MSEAKIELITKLLAKAESTTPEEAEALTEHAERLMLKYGIERARIDEQHGRGGRGHEEIVTERMLFSGSYARDIRGLGASVATALGAIRPLYSSNHGGEVIMYLVGHASDVRQAQLLIASLQVQSMVAMRSWWSTERHRYRWDTESDRRRARSGFVRGFGAGAAERIRESRRTIVEDSDAGTDLVLVSRSQRVDAAAAAMTTGRGRPRRGTDAEAFRHGRHSGLEASTGEQAVGARRV